MADNRASRAESEPPAGGSRPDASRAATPGSSDEARKSDSKFRLVTPDAIFDEGEPNDESPTIISKNPTKHGTPQDTNDLSGRRLAHFELGESIGVGGMAAVFKARDTQLDRPVALKILPPPMARDPENIRRFHQEARAAAKLDHENIARVFYCGEDQGLHFIAFEYVEGQNLRMLLERRGRLPVNEAVRYVLQVATGLEHAASRGVVHRDIKPSNIIITPGGRAKVVDMGLARSLEPHADNGLTQSGVTLGTFDYISPEQALEPRDADQRSDIYSLGCTFYHVLTGKAPVPEGTAAKKLQHHQSVAPTDPRQLNPEVSDDVARILSKMMAKNPRDRYQRPIELVQHLMQVARATGDDSNVEQLFVDVQMPLAPRRRPMLMIVIAGLTLAALLFVLSLAPQPKRANNKPIVPPPPDPPPTPKNVEPTPAPAVTEINSEDDLQFALRVAADSKTKTTIPLKHDIVLTGKVAVDATRSKPNIEIVGANKQPVRLILRLDKAPTSPLAGLRIAGAKVDFKNLRFEIVAGDTVKRLDVPVAAVAVNDGAVVDFVRCSFAQSGAFLTQQGLVPVASLLLNVAKTAPVVTLKESYFQSGQTAVAVAGSGKVTLVDCAFHTLGALFQLKGGGEPMITLDHCSAHLRNGPAFRIDDDTACKLKVEFCLFSVPDDAASADSANLIHQTGSADPRKVSYRGRVNAYHNLNNMWVSDKAEKRIVAHELVPFLQALGVSDIEIEKKTEKQLAPDQRPFLTPESDDPGEAFRLDPNVNALRLPAGRIGANPAIGARQILDAKIEPLEPLPPEPGPVALKPAPGEKIVDPDHLAVVPGVYTSLATALADDRTPADVITLKPSTPSQPFTIKPTTLETDLTIRGYPGSFPTLTVDDTRLRDVCLFHLLDKKLTLENLNLVLEPTRDGYRSMALVALIGNGSLTLKNCTVTLKSRGPKGAPLSVVSIAATDDGKAMMAEARPTANAPTVIVQDTFVRGDGDLITIDGSRPANVQVERSLLVLGSLLHQSQCATKEMDAAMTVKLKDSVFFHAKPLFWLQAGKGTSRFQQPVRVESEHCLFALAGKPLVLLEAPEISEQTLTRFFDWKGQKNAYADGEKSDNANYFLDYAPPDDTLRAFQFDRVVWDSLFDPNNESNFFPAAFEKLPERPFAQSPPDAAVVAPGASLELQPYFAKLPRFQAPRN